MREPIKQPMRSEFNSTTSSSTKPFLLQSFPRTTIFKTMRKRKSVLAVLLLVPLYVAHLWKEHQHQQHLLNVVDGGDHVVDDCEHLHLNETIYQNPICLELVHIPKTGGSTLEIIAAAQNISWGKCHYSNLPLKGPLAQQLECPPTTQCQRKDRFRYKRIPSDSISNIRISGVVNRWHLPISPEQEYAGWHPFKGGEGVGCVNITAFVVVRNPYSRAVSQTNYLYKNTNASHLNHHIQSVLNLIKEGEQKRITPTTRMIYSRNPYYYVQDGHWIPQHAYLRVNQSFPVTIRVLKFENLAEEFDALMQEFGLSTMLRLPPRSSSSKVNKNKITVQDLTDETRQMIYDYYRRDFELFGYEKWRICCTANLQVIAAHRRLPVDGSLDLIAVRRDKKVHSPYKGVTPDTTLCYHNIP